MRPTEEQLAQLTDHQIRGLAGLLGFSGLIKGAVKAKLPAAFLAALDKKCGGDIPTHIWRIGREQTPADSLESLRQRVAAAARDDEEASTGRKRLMKAGPSRGTPLPQGPLDAEPLPRCRSARLARRECAMDLDDSDSANGSDDGHVDHPPPWQAHHLVQRRRQRSTVSSPCLRT